MDWPAGAGRANSAQRPAKGPATWLLDNVELLRPGMRVLDVAAGRGRHALLFAAAGFPVTAVDRDAAALARLAETAAALGTPLDDAGASIWSTAAPTSARAPSTWSS